MKQKELSTLLHQYQTEIELELKNILKYWMQHSVDKVHGGFIGRIDQNGSVDPAAIKGSVLNARILWTFSAAYLHTKDEALLAFANRAYHYINTYFIDEIFGGVYWSVHANGSPADEKKQVYAMAFMVYGLSAYYNATKNEDAKQTAIRLYNLIEEHAYDPVYGGYIEALSRNWQPAADLRLSGKDANEKKSMNTHLHVLEAYTALYLIWPDKKLQQQLTRLVQLFSKHIIDPLTHHQHLFFSETWEIRSAWVSFGHDVEAAWLLPEAAACIDDDDLFQKVNACSVSLVSAAARGLDNDGGLWYEYFPEEQRMIKEKHWWPQAEAMVGFLHAWEITGDKIWLHRSIQNWEFVKQKMLDTKKGEWFWGIDATGNTMPNQDKAGFWKCPYHNTRACLQIIHRINQNTHH